MAGYYTRAPRPKPVSTERPVDVFAGKGSVADTLKKRRQALESGDPSAGAPTVGGDNSPDQVINRGYFTEKHNE